MKNIKTFTYTENDQKIKISFDDSVYINATEASKLWGKSRQILSNFINDHVKPYAKKLINAGIIPSQENLDLADLVIVRKGGNDATKKGTWLHPKLAVMFARWLSIDFEIWCDQKINELLYSGKTEATAKERSGWLDKLPHLFKSMDYYKHWGPKFKNVVIEINKESDKIQTHKDFVKQCASKYKGDSVKIYNRMIQYYNDLFEEGVIERRLWEDITNYMFIRIRQILSGRLTKEHKKSERLLESTKKIKENLGKILEPEKYPPIPVDSIVLNTSEDLNALDRTIKNIDGATLLYKGFLQYKGRNVSDNGKNLPEFVSPLNGSAQYNIAGWSNTNYTSILFKASLYKKSITFNCSENNGLFVGTMVGSIGIRYFLIMNPDTLATIVYKHTLTKENIL
jgi:hypothetical protein